VQMHSKNRLTDPQLRAQGLNFMGAHRPYGRGADGRKMSEDAGSNRRPQLGLPKAQK
jgi:hypothetical protein